MPLFRLKFKPFPTWYKKNDKSFLTLSSNKKTPLKVIKFGGVIDLNNLILHELEQFYKILPMPFPALSYQNEPHPSSDDSVFCWDILNQS